MEAGLVTKECTNKQIDELALFIKSIIKQCYPPIYSNDVIDFFVELHSPENLKKKTKKGLVLLGYYENELIACGTLYKKEICGVYVNTQYHRKGFGKVLVSKLIQTAINKGYDHIWLDSTPIAFDFYKSLGFQLTEERTIYINNNSPLPHFRMYKPLHG